MFLEPILLHLNFWSFLSKTTGNHLIIGVTFAFSLCNKPFKHLDSPSKQCDLLRIYRRYTNKISKKKKKREKKIGNLFGYFKTFTKQHHKEINAHLNIQMTQVTKKLNAHAYGEHTPSLTNCVINKPIIGTYFRDVELSPHVFDDI